MQKLKFPPGFLWGAAGSAYQTEGNNKNSDWWAWEHSVRRENFLRRLGKNPADFYSGEACDFWNRYDEDFGLAQHLNHNATRFGIEWSRVQPNMNEFDEKALDHYEKMLQSAKFHGLQVFFTLHHFTSPVWFMKKGGFTKKENITYYVQYARRVVNRLSEYVDFWLTFNEPEVYSNLSYVTGVYPPQVKSIRTAWKVVNNIITAHNLVSQYIKQTNPKPVSMAFHLSDIQPSGRLSEWVAEFAHYIANEYIIRKTIDHCDFIGVNYYFHHHMGLFGFRHHSESQHPETDLGWGIHPDGLERVLLNLRKYYKPIYITENGLADARDIKREQYIKDHLYYAHRAWMHGVDLRGYLYWSLIDNFEWEKGFAPRFGLIEIERESMLRRKVRYSATKFAEICKNNYIEI